MAGQHILGPTSHYFYSQRLKLHYVVGIGTGSLRRCAKTITSLPRICAAMAIRSGLVAASTP